MMAHTNRIITSGSIRIWKILSPFITIVSLSLWSCDRTMPVEPEFIEPTPVFTPTPLLSINNTDQDLDKLIEELNKNMPRAKTEKFVTPTKSAQQTFQNATQAIKSGVPEIAAMLVTKYDYNLLKVSDLGDNRAESYILLEDPPITKGWGFYAFRIHSPRNIVIESPHPLFDKNTPEVALNLYRALRANALLISGAHRSANKDGSSDVAHAPESIFQTVHTSLYELESKPANETIFLQIHGYSTSDHPGYPQVIIGYNWKNDPNKDKLLIRLLDALGRKNILAGICSGDKYKGLCGTKNIQRKAMNGGIFIHLELSESLRNDDIELVESIREALAP